MSEGAAERNGAGEIAAATARPEPRLLAFAAFIAFGLAIFAFIAQRVVGAEPHAIDNAILIALRDGEDLSRPAGPGWLQYFMRDLTALSGWPALAMLTLFLGGYLALRGKWSALFLVIAAVAGEALLVEALKGFFGRERPSVVPHLVAVSNYSFPSGHATSAAAVYLILGAILARASERRAVRLYVIGASIAMALLIGFSRLYLGVHYPTDVLAGFALGAAWAAMVWVAGYYLEQRFLPEA